MEAFITSFLFVVLAEMGDKTQLLAMAFTSRYSAHKVLLAVFLATIINHGLSVAVGHLLATYVSMHVISLVAAFSFILFGLWTIRGDPLDGEDQRESRFGPVVTVGIAFFLAEIGDKTQLATISLAVEYQCMLNVLMGTTLGMIIADGIGIILGVVMRKHIPDTAIKWISAVIFVLFGFCSIYEILVPHLDSILVWGILLVTSMSTFYAARYLTMPKEAESH